MRPQKIRTLAAAMALGGMCTLASAIPQLQLGILNGTYDNTTDTVISSSKAFTLYAFLTPKTNASQADIDALLADTYYISAALTPKETAQPPGGATLGKITFAGTDVNVTGGMTYGVPPFETIAAYMGDDNGDLADHGIFDTYYKEFSFKFLSTNVTSALNTVGCGGSTPDCDGNNTSATATNLSGIPDGGSGMYFAMFTVDTNLLTAGAIHFDLYSSTVCSGGQGQCNGVDDIDVNKFAPFSHDAQSSSGSTSTGNTSTGNTSTGNTSTGNTSTGSAPEPGSTALVGLGLGILGLGFLRRRKMQQRIA